MKRHRQINLKRSFRKARARARLSGNRQRPRASVFRSNKFLYLQLIDDSQGRTLLFSSGKKGAKGAAQLGEKAAALAKKAGINSVLFDRGPYKYHGQIKILADSLRQAGLKI